jgi:hypothetical protein
MAVGPIGVVGLVAGESSWGHRPGRINWSAFGHSTTDPLDLLVAFVDMFEAGEGAERKRGF